VYIEGFEESTRLKGAARWAQAPIGFAVSATRDVNVVEHKKGSFFLPSIFWNQRVTGEGGQIFEFKGLIRKIRKTKEIGLRDPFPVQPLLGILWPVAS